MSDRHPLDPLDAGEITRSVALARTVPGLGSRVRVIFVEAREPDKAAYHAWRDGGAPLARTAIVTMVDCEHGRGLVADVDLDNDRLGEVTQLDDGVQPAISGDEFFIAQDVMRADPRFREAISKRGIDDPEKVYIESWSAGVHEPGPRRMVRAICWLKEQDTDNQYARPLYGLVGAVDINALELLRLDDHAPGTPPPPPGGDYRNGGGRPYRSDVKPLEITQPDGPGFALEGHGVRWQNWELRIGFHPREGLVLHDIAYHDAGERRQICHRASIAELVIPYGDPNPTTHFKNVFDIGEYGLGPLTNSLSLGCDCVGEIRYLDAVTNTYTGDLFEIPNAICIHEEDYGLLWKHTDEFGRVDRARSRRLVISSIVTVGNYEYGFFWYLYQDATWQFEAKLTGIVHSAGWVSDERSPYSLPLGEGFVTSHHQHFFCARLDLDVDGTANTAFQSEAVMEPWGDAQPRRRRVPARAPDVHERVGRPRAPLARDRPAVPGREPGARESDRRSGLLRAGARRLGGADAAARLVGAQARAVHRLQPLGHAVPGRRALSGGRVPQPARRRGRPARVDGGRSAARGHRRGALVRVRRAPLPAARGLARDAGRVLRLPPAAGGVLRRESGARRATAGALRTLTRRRLYAALR